MVINRTDHVVFFGGGTGLSTLAAHAESVWENLTLVPANSDDGGSTGFFRKIGEPAYGDMSKVITAVSANGPKRKDRIRRKTRDKRFGDEYPVELRNHTVRNLMLHLAYLENGRDLNAAIRQVMRNCGCRPGIKVLPASLESSNTHARLADGTELLGEHVLDIKDSERRIEKFSLRPRVKVNPELEELLPLANKYVIACGSWFGSVMSVLRVDGIPDLILKGLGRGAKLFLVVNALNDNQTPNYAAGDFARWVYYTLGERKIDYALVHDAPVPEQLLARYSDEDKFLVETDADFLEKYVNCIIEGSFLEDCGTLRHSKKVVQVIEKSKREVP